MDDFELTVSESDREQFKRLDHFLTHHLKDYSRTFLRRLFEEDLISAEFNDAATKLELKKMPAAGTIITIEVPAPVPDEAIPQDIPLEILYEDEYLLFVNKPAGLVTHPAPGNPDQTLVNALLFHVKDLKGIGGSKRPGIVHRLDKGTSGVMVVAKEQKTHEALVVLFSRHDLIRKYESLAMGTFQQAAGTVTGPIGRHPVHRQKMSVNTRNGRNATTHFKVLQQYAKIAHVELQLETGRTHQIRVHLSQVLQHAILNDSTYGNPNEHKQRLGPAVTTAIGNYPYPYLHAKMLALKHPITGALLEFSVPRPLAFQTVLDSLETNRT